jgi:competence protein ComEC
VTRPADEERPDLRLVLPALAAWSTAWQAPSLPPEAVLVGGGLTLVMALVLLAARRPRATVAAAVCGGVAAAALVTGVHTVSRTTGPLAALAEDRAAVTAVGVLTDDPRRSLRQQARGGELVVAALRVERVHARGREHRLRSPVVVLSTEAAWLPLLPSQRVRVEGLLRPAEPGDDVAAVLGDRGGPTVLSGPSRVQAVAGQLRAGLREAVAPLPAAEQGLLPGLVVGDTSRLDDDLREDFRTVGLSHLVAVSGTNCSIVVGAVVLLAARLRLGARASPVLALLALVGFVVLARPSPSVLRAAVMGAVGLAALATGTRRAALPALSAAVLVLVLADPDLARAPGFALSVLATAGLLVLAPPWTAGLARRLPLWLAAAIAVPAAAHAACGPVVVALSAQLGLLSVPANVLAVPAVAPATVAGVLAALLAPVALPLAQAVAWVGWLPTAWLVLVARTGAGLPGSSLPWPGGGRGALLLAVLTAVALVALARRRLRLGALAVTIGVLLASVGLGLARPAWPPPGWVAVACDVGQGDALVLAAGRGAAVVVDAGPEPRAVDGCLRRLDVDVVPVVLLTHPHADHVAGLPGVLRGRAVGAVHVGPGDDESGEQERLVQRWAERARVPVQRPALHEVRTLGDLRWEVLAPTRAYRGTRSDPNNASLVLRVEVGGTRLLLPGDAEPEAQRDLVRSGADLHADVLKTPHHGSRYQDEGFLRAVAARVVVTSVGADNTYGHPADSTLAQLTADGAASFRTDLDGDVAIVRRGGRLVVVPRGGASGRGSGGGEAPRAASGTVSRHVPRALPDRDQDAAEDERGQPGEGQVAAVGAGARQPPVAVRRRAARRHRAARPERAVGTRGGARRDRAGEPGGQPCAPGRSPARGGPSGRRPGRRAVSGRAGHGRRGAGRAGTRTGRDGRRGAGRSGRGRGGPGRRDGADRRPAAGRRSVRADRARDVRVVEGDGPARRDHTGEQAAVDHRLVAGRDRRVRQDRADEGGAGAQGRRAADGPEDVAGLGPADQSHDARRCRRQGAAQPEQEDGFRVAAAVEDERAGEVHEARVVDTGRQGRQAGSARVLEQHVLARAPVGADVGGGGPGPGGVGLVVGDVPAAVPDDPGGKARDARARTDVQVAAEDGGAVVRDRCGGQHCHRLGAGEVEPSGRGARRGREQQPGAGAQSQAGRDDQRDDPGGAGPSGRTGSRRRGHA